MTQKRGYFSSRYSIQLFQYTVFHGITLASIEAPEEDASRGAPPSSTIKMLTRFLKQNRWASDKTRRDFPHWNSVCFFATPADFLS